MLMPKASHWCAGGSRPALIGQVEAIYALTAKPRHMNGCLLTCSKTIRSCQGSAREDAEAKKNEEEAAAGEEVPFCLTRVFFLLLSARGAASDGTRSFVDTT